MRRSRVLRAVAGAAAAAALTAVLGLCAPLLADAPAVCPTLRLAGTPCPGCGATRAVARLARGEWSRAVALHPLAPLVALDLVLVGAVAASGPGAPGGRMRRLALPAAVLHGAAFVGVWSWRLAAGTLP